MKSNSTIDTTVPPQEDIGFLKEVAGELSGLPATILIRSDDEESGKLEASMLVSRFIANLGTINLFVIPDMPLNSEVKKFDEVKEWFDESKDGGLPEGASESSVPILYIPNISDLYNEPLLLKLVQDSNSLGLIVIAVAGSIEKNSRAMEMTQGLFTHVIDV